MNNQRIATLLEAAATICHGCAHGIKLHRTNIGWVHQDSEELSLSENVMTCPASPIRDLIEAEDTPPERRHVLTLNLQADTWEDLVSSFNNISFELHRPGKARDLVSGGYNSGYVLQTWENDGMDHDLYCRQNEAWLARRRDKKNTQPEGGTS